MTKAKQNEVSSSRISRSCRVRIADTSHGVCLSDPSVTSFRWSVGCPSAAVTMAVPKSRTMTVSRIYDIVLRLLIWIMETGCAMTIFLKIFFFNTNLKRFSDFASSFAVLLDLDLAQDPNTYKVQNNASHWDKTQRANFRGNPLYLATKRHVNNKMKKKNMKNEKES